jgi:predicted deacylase
MPGNARGNRSDVYAFHLIDRIAKHFDYLIDLHTASFGRVNSLYVRADMSNEVTASMARLQRPQIILHDPPSDYTLRGALNEIGIPAITLEICDPHKFQPESIRRSLTGVLRVLSLLEMLPPRKVPDSPPPIICEGSRWLYTDRGGLLTVLPDVTDYVSKDQIIARQTNVFGDVVREYRSPTDGVIIGHSTDPVSQTGARIVHLGSIRQDAASATEGSAG